MAVRSAVRTGRFYHPGKTEAVSTPGKDFTSMKNPVTPAGIEPATFRFVAQRLNHCAVTVAHHRVYLNKPK